MSSPLDRLITLQITVKASQPEVLEGLDVWLRLGLLSDEQVIQLSRQYLCCSLKFQPQARQQSAVATPPVTVAVGPQFPEELPDLDEDFAAMEAVPRKVNPPPSFVGQMLHSLMAELSVRWLLFLGVFMVVVSSGVLAASQWERFPAAGQYGVLLAYTLIFCGVSFWAGKQPNLRLTAQTLQIVTLLLVPVNFWAMDSFGLWQNPLDWITVAVSAVVLTAVTVLLIKNQPPATQLRVRRLQSLPVWNTLGLSYLHWGWKLSGFPLIAVYVGMVGTTLATFYQVRYRQQQDSISAQTPQPPISFTSAVVIYALAVLLVRAIFVVQVNITQLGLAIGICGWLIAWLAQQSEAKNLQLEARSENSPSTTQNSVTESTARLNQPQISLQFPWEIIGGGLLFLGWLVCVGNVFPWQATAVSGLGLWFFFSRLQHFWRQLDFLALFIVGLQAGFLVLRLVPLAQQTWILATATQLTGSEGIPWALLSLALFPYILVMVGMTEWLYLRSKPELASFGEQLTLIFGSLLTLLSLLNPTLRTLNLLFSTLTLGVVTQRRSPTRVGLVYLTHITGLLTLGSAVNRLSPNLNLEIWASILLAVMLAEWVFSFLGNRQETKLSSLWQQSAWHIGLGLAAISYQLLLANSGAYGDRGPISRQQWGVIWLITPLTLTGVASQTTQPRRNIAAWLSVVALAMSQLLLIMLPGGRLIGLGVATGLMLANTRYLRQLPSAIITVGFGLSFIGVLLADGIPGLPQLTADGWLVVGAIIISGLWLGRGWLLQRQGTLAYLYAQSADGWANALCGFQLLLLTAHSLGVYWQVFSPTVPVFIAIVLTMVAIAYRNWLHPNNWGFYALGWGLELLTAEALGFVGHSVINLAIANVALGLMTQLIGEFWRWRHSVDRMPISWHIIPLLYGALGAVLRWGIFTSWTGLATLAIALIAIGIGRRREDFKGLLYLGIVGVSVSAYELLFYQLSQVLGGTFGDGLVAMSALGTSIMYAYRLLSPWLTDYLGLSAKELKIVAHIHWAWSSCLLLAAIPIPIESSRLVGLGTGVFLIRYAIFQGRYHPDPKWAEIWVYLGLGETAGIRIYWIYTAVGQFITGPLGPWKAPISCVIAYYLYILPWETWGWPKRPWHQAAYILPLVMLWESRAIIPILGLLLTAGFYLLLARLTAQLRFTYISVLLVDWVLCRWFSELGLTDWLWYVTLISFSLLYVAQFDPDLQQQSQKETRHLLRLLATGLICGWALVFQQETGLVPGILGIVAIFVGLALRIRAFLYIGTATFLLTGFYQLVLFIFRYPFFKWVIGLLVGISFISIAANFETRRDQLSSLLRNQVTEFQDWQ